MSTNYRNSGGVDTDALFDPDVIGDGPVASGFRMSSGAEMRYAAAKYGTPGASIGMRNASGSDYGPMWAAKGTASYALAINGQGYGISYSVPIGYTAYAAIGFRIVNGNAWQVYEYSSTQATTVLASGSLPASASTVKYTWGSPTVLDGSSSGGSTSNGAASVTAVSSNPSAVYTTSAYGSSTTSHGMSYPFTVDIYDSGGKNISHSVCSLSAQISGSA